MIVIYISWKTKIESQKTGIQLHKIANVVDENHFYNVCNHLSLKLLNHQLNFTACGFFDLDMTTVYAVSLNTHHLLKKILYNILYVQITGAITSYLIILIQFNLAAIRVKPTAPTNDTEITNITELLATTFMPPLMFNNTQYN